MQLKSLSALAGAFILALTVVPFAVQAQTASVSPLLIAQTPKKGFWQRLGLTEEQKAKMQGIARSTRAQIDEVLTSEQKAKLETARQARQVQRQQGQRPQVGEFGGKKFAQLNLSDDQKKRIREIRKSSQQQMEAILTDEQRAKLQDLKARRGKRWEQRQQQNSN